MNDYLIGLEKLKQYKDDYDSLLGEEVLEGELEVVMQYNQPQFLDNNDY
jgi:hypothetical protein